MPESYDTPDRASPGVRSERQDRLDVAQSKLRELEVFASKEMIFARYLINDLQLVLEYCSVHLYEQQITRIKEIVSNLETSLSSENIPAIETYSAEARQELKNKSHQKFF